MSTRIAEIIRRYGLVQARLAEACGIGRSTMCQLIQGKLPRHNRPSILAILHDALVVGGATEAEVADALEELKTRDACTRARPADKRQPATEPDPKEDIMLFKKQSLTSDARQAFGLARNPFDEPQSPEAVYLTPRSRYAREALYDAAINGNLLALVGESGSGKTTLVREMETRLAEEHPEVMIIRPYVLTMSPKDSGAGRPLRISHILEAILAAVEPDSRRGGSPEAISRRAHEALTRSSRAGNRHLMVIEEAHDMHTQPLKSLKRLWEMRDGLKRLLSIVLVGQTELGDRLTSTSADVREVVQRCDVVMLPPLPDIGDFLRHRFAAVGLDADRVFTPDAYDALRQRTITGQDARGRGVDMAYPLAVSNLATACINFAAAGGMRQVNDDVVRTVQV